MKIALEAQHACRKRNAGVGKYTWNIIKNLLEMDSLHEWELQLFDFLFLEKNDKKLLDNIENKNKIWKVCPFCHYGILARFPFLYNFFPYHTFFPTKADIHHFFNFIIPRNIRGKTITTLHDMCFFRYPETLSKTNYRILGEGLKRSAHQADAIVTVSKNSKKEIIEFLQVPEDKIHIVCPGVDRKVFFPKKNRETKISILQKYAIPGDFFLYLGTMEPRKNIPFLLKAFQIFSQKERNIWLVLAGQKGWGYKEIEDCIHELAIQDRIVLADYIPQEDMASLYSSAEVFLFPSLYEGFGIPPLEAMACGTPVIVSGVSSLPEVVEDAGILVPPDDIENLAFQMQRLTRDRSLQKFYSRKGQERSLLFSWQKSAKKLLDIYGKL